MNRTKLERIVFMVDELARLFAEPDCEEVSAELHEMKERLEAAQARIDFSHLG